ncbi:MAG: YbjN domain-containing protein [Sphingomonadales bacterium]|nr:YbjN domain-containing protein [Sphingomonadales bacterium]NCQ21303.1 YbjN domain-containing protein [Sphingomonadales bacterium]NCT03467.1 YbjN domain-containing protein [Sphingomonadales bacterium]
MIRWMAAALLAASFAGAGQAQTVTAANPEGLQAAMKSAGYEGELTTDQVGDPMIKTEINGWSVAILFYGCDEESHQDCDSVQFSRGFDRKTAMDPARALEIASKWRFLAVSLDEEGDPYLRWDIVTADGIPQSVFMTAFRLYGESLDDAAEIIFEDEQ